MTVRRQRLGGGTAPAPVVVPELLHTMHGSAQYLSAALALVTLLVVLELFLGSEDPLAWSCTFEQF